MAITVNKVFNDKPKAGALKPGQIGQYNDANGNPVYVIAKADGTFTKPQTTLAAAETKYNQIKQELAKTGSVSFVPQATKAMGLTMDANQLADRFTNYYYSNSALGLAPKAGAPTKAEIKTFANNLAAAGQAYQNTTGQFGELYYRVISGEIPTAQIPSTLKQMQELSKLADKQLGDYNKLAGSGIVPKQDLTALGLPSTDAISGLQIAEAFALPKETWNMNPAELMTWITKHEEKMGEDSFGSIITGAGLSTILNFMLPGAGTLLTTALGTVPKAVVSSVMASTIQGIQQGLTPAEIAQNAALAGGGAYVGSIISDYFSASNMSPGIKLKTNAAGQVVDAATGNPFTAPGVSGITSNTALSSLTPGVNLLSGAGLTAFNNAITSGMDDALAGLISDAPVLSSKTGATVGDLMDVNMPNTSSITNSVNLNPITSVPGGSAGINLTTNADGRYIDLNTNRPFTPPGIDLGRDVAGNIVDAATGLPITGTGVNIVNPETGNYAGTNTGFGTGGDLTTTGSGSSLLDDAIKVAKDNPLTTAATIGAVTLIPAAVDNIKDLLNPKVDGGVTYGKPKKLTGVGTDFDAVPMPDWFNNLYERQGYGAGQYLGYDILNNLNIPDDVMGLLGGSVGQNTGSSLIA